MPRAKKASLKTKAVDMKAKKRNVKQPKKTRDEGAELQQTFTNSLSQLSAYWKKRVATTQKQIESTRATLKKTQDKLKATKVSPTAKKAMQNREKLQIAIIDAKNTLTIAKQEQSAAKLEAKKYVQLSKAISAIEKDCRKQLAELAAIAKEEAKQEKAKAKAKLAKTNAKKTTAKEKTKKVEAKKTTAKEKTKKAEPKKTTAKEKTKKVEPKKTTAKAKVEKAAPIAPETTKKRGRKPKVHLAKVTDVADVADVAEILEESNMDQALSDALTIAPDFNDMLEQEAPTPLVIDSSAEGIEEDNDAIFDY